MAERRSPQGAVAAAGAATAARMSKSTKKPRKGNGPTQRFAGVTASDKANIEAWETFAAARAVLLRTTGTASVQAAEAKARASTVAADKVRRARNVAASTTRAGADRKQPKVSAQGAQPSPASPGRRRRSTSVRTVSGGIPGGGKRR